MSETATTNHENHLMYSFQACSNINTKQVALGKCKLLDQVQNKFAYIVGFYHFIYIFKLC